jgi:hypothetical protein
MHLLSLTDGKFRVKFASLRCREAYVVNVHRNNDRQSKQCEGLRLLRDVPAPRKTFSLGRTVVIIDNDRPQKPAFPAEEL